MTTELAIALTTVDRALDNMDAEPAEFLVAANNLLNIVEASDYCLLGTPGMVAYQVWRASDNTDDAVRAMITVAARVAYLLGMSRALYGADPFIDVAAAEVTSCHPLTC